MKKSIILFVMAAVFSVGMIFYGCIFVDSQIGEAMLTEETVTGDRKEADGLTVGFRADAGDDLHWINSYDYSSSKTDSVFKRGEMPEAAETSIYDDIQRDKTFVGTMLKTVKTSIYDDIRFTGWSAAPFTTKLNYEELEGLQEKEIHDFYDEIQQRVVESSTEEKGKIRLKDYLDYYPVSFRFRFGTNRYDSGNALTGLKIYDEQGEPSSESGAAYDEDVALYTVFNTMFQIPVIDNEYQEYTISGVEGYDPENSLAFTADVKKPSGEGEDYYEFDPIMVIQEESNNGEAWTHTDLEGAQDGLKNRMLFIVNNRTAKGASVDVSQIEGGYGVYELPIEVGAKAAKIGHRVVSVPDPTPLPDRMAMVYQLDETAEYVEMSLSGDHRYLAVFSVKDGDYLVEIVDADTWKSQGAIEMFPASEKMTYAWGEDGSLAVTNHEGYVAALCRNHEEKAPPKDDSQNGTAQEEDSYRLVYNGKVGSDFCEAFFDMEMIYKKNSYAKYQYGIDEGLAIAAKDGKIALVQNQPVRLSKTSIRNASLECAVINETGVIYRGRLNSNIVDMKYDMRPEEKQEVEDYSGGGEASKAVNCIVQPVRNKNRVMWQ